jgi:folylpolyglutamate synthase/dihydropteroate synthase
LILDNKEIQRLFERFSEPLLRPCVSTAQKEKAIGISKLLWLALITETDSEHSIYEILARILNYDHDAIIALGSLYFFKMKLTLKQRAL